ncbi:daptide-type RiPP [Streptomyces sp. AK02-01A]|nr:daptide-type RiPP [Streptomyces sp. AK02-01A]MDX3854081.1 hypothetical protein [Streptomyces sp. AK02-01A]MDX3854082.1 hypothetical protein [Streptomyces sp. AK02-01A]
MNEQLDVVGMDAQGLELGLQELEALEAPGFWEGVSIGIAISTVIVAT